MTYARAQLRPDISRWLVVVLTAAILVAACGGAHKQGASSAAAVPSGWQSFSAPGFALALPASFVGGAQGTDTLANAVLQLKGMGEPDLASKLQVMTPNEALQMIDGDGSAAVTVFHVSAPADLVLADYDIFNSLNPAASGLKLLDRKTVSVGALKTERLQMHSDSLAVDMIAYYVHQGTTLWSVVYTSSPSTTTRWTPVFDQSAQTIDVTD